MEEGIDVSNILKEIGMIIGEAGTITGELGTTTIGATETIGGNLR